MAKGVLPSECEDGPTPADGTIPFEAKAASDLWSARMALMDSTLWTLRFCIHANSACPDAHAMCLSASLQESGVSRNPTRLTWLMRCPCCNNPYLKRLASVTNNCKFIKSSGSWLMARNLST